MLQINYKPNDVSYLRLCGLLPADRMAAVHAPYGETIKRLRERAGLSQQDLATKAGVHRDTVIRAEQSGNVGVLLLYQIADALDTDVTVSFGPAETAPDDERSRLATLAVRLGDEQLQQLVRLAKRYLGEAGT